LALGGFDTALDVGTPTGGGGDLELFFRVVAAGHQVVYEPSAVVRHRHRQTMEQLVRQKRGDGTASYSWFVGAGRHYGTDEYVGFLRFALRWAIRHHGRGLIVSGMWPAFWSPATRRAEARGAVDAVVRNYYRRAVRHAAAEAARHPDEPTAPPLQRGHDLAPQDLEPPQSVDVDLDAGVLHASRSQLASRSGQETVVVVRRGVEPVMQFRLSTGGVGISAARLRWELAERLASGDSV
jgi:hypothetical protein